MVSAMFMYARFSAMMAIFMAFFGDEMPVFLLPQ